METIPPHTDPHDSYAFWAGKLSAALGLALADPRSAFVSRQCLAEYEEWKAARQLRVLA